MATVNTARGIEYSGFMYAPMVSMTPTPMPSEKKACPAAVTTTAAVKRVQSTVNRKRKAAPMSAKPME